MEKFVTAKDIRSGDRVQLETDEWVTVTSVGKGMYEGSKLIEWKGNPAENWCHIMPGQQVPGQRQRER